MFYKRLDRGTFTLPKVEEGASHLEIDESALEALLDGLEVGARSTVH